MLNTRTSIAYPSSAVLRRRGVPPFPKSIAFARKGLSMVLFRPHSATAAVRNVLNGKTADGTAPLRQPVPFTKDPHARCAAICKLQMILSHCHRQFQPEDVTPFTVKFLTHLRKTGLQDRDAIIAFQTLPLITAIMANPLLLSSRAGIPAMLRSHQRSQQQARAALLRCLQDDVPDRRLVWSSPPYSLEEVTDPRHLQHDSLVLGHCAGTLHLPQALRHHKLAPDHPDAIHYLRYWVRIKNGDSRIFTFIENGVPAYTIETAPSTQTVVVVQGATSNNSPPPPLLNIAIAAAIRSPRLSASPEPRTAVPRSAGPSSGASPARTSGHHPLSSVPES